MDYALTFALLLYFNVFYFTVFASLEFVLLLLKVFSQNGSRSSSYSSTVLINELLILTFLVVVESIRLTLGQRSSKEDFDRNLASVFRILVLTVPSMYAVAYFAFWQNFVSRLDLTLGSIMLVIQGCQVLSSFFILVVQFQRRNKKIPLTQNPSQGQKYRKMGSED